VVVMAETVVVEAPVDVATLVSPKDSTRILGTRRTRTNGRGAQKLAQRSPHPLPK
jgi:hypothetical protein